MATPEETVAYIVNSANWDERVARLRQIPQRHGTDEHSAIYAKVANRLYVPHLAPDYAYVHSADFYDLPHFQHAAPAENGAAVCLQSGPAGGAFRSRPTPAVPLREAWGVAIE